VSAVMSFAFSSKSVRRSQIHIVDSQTDIADTQVIRNLFTV